MGKPEKTVLEKVFQLSEPLGIVQHHDAITGTARQYVTDDYSKRLSVGMEQCEQVVNEAFKKLVQNPLNVHSSSSSASASTSAEITNLASTFNYQFCQLVNISACAAAENSTDFLVSIYNPLGRNLQNTYIRIPVSSMYWNVQARRGTVKINLLL